MFMIGLTILCAIVGVVFIFFSVSTDNEEASTSRRSEAAVPEVDSHIDAA